MHIIGFDSTHFKAARSSRSCQHARAPPQQSAETLTTATIVVSNNISRASARTAMEARMSPSVASGCANNTDGALLPRTAHGHGTGSATDAVRITPNSAGGRAGLGKRTHARTSSTPNQVKSARVYILVCESNHAPEGVRGTCGGIVVQRKRVVAEEQAAGADEPHSAGAYAWPEHALRESTPFNHWYPRAR